MTGFTEGALDEAPLDIRNDLTEFKGVIFFVLVFVKP